MKSKFLISQVILVSGLLLAACAPQSKQQQPPSVRSETLTPTVGPD